MKFLSSQLVVLARGINRNSNTRLLAGFVAVLLFFIISYSIIFHALMAFEGKDYSWITGLYWALTVMSTLGFGDITFASDIGKIFSMVVLLSGIIFLLVMLPFTFIQFFYAPWLDAQNKARAPRMVSESLSGHVILTHFDAVAVSIVEKLKQYEIAYVILVSDLSRALEIHDMGYKVVVGELDDPQTYLRLRVHHASLVAVLNDSVAATNIVFSIREVCDQVLVVANADVDDSLDILNMAGSTHVFQFTKMLGQALARRVLGLEMKANVIGRFEDLLIAEAPCMRTPLQGQTLAQSRLRERCGVTVVGMWQQGQFLYPGPDTRMGESTVLVLAGTEEQLGEYDRLMGYKTGPEEAQGPVLVLGGGRVGKSVAKTLENRGMEYVVVEKRPSIGAEDSHFIHGSADDLDILISAGIRETPSIIITTHDDDLNIYLTIYCRQLRPDVQIISRASLDRNINTLHRAGANLVMSFSSLCASTLLNLLQPGKLLMLSEGLNMFRVPLGRKLENTAIIDAHIREDTGCSVVAVQRDGKMIANPAPSLVLQKADEIILIGSVKAEKAFLKKYPADARKNNGKE
jgi:Trk K+ transport system NAD-binding subunit